MHVIKGMVGCLGDMETVMIKLHEEPITRKSVLFIVALKEEVGCGDTGWPGKKRVKTVQSQGELGNEALIELQ